MKPAMQRYWARVELGKCIVDGCELPLDTKRRCQYHNWMNFRNSERSATWYHKRKETGLCVGSSLCNEARDGVTMFCQGHLRANNARTLRIYHARKKGGSCVATTCIHPRAPGILMCQMHRKAKASRRTSAKDAQRRRYWEKKVTGVCIRSGCVNQAGEATVQCDKHVAKDRGRRRKSGRIIVVDVREEVVENRSGSIGRGILRAAGLAVPAKAPSRDDTGTTGS